MHIIINIKLPFKESLTEQIHATLNLTIDLSGIGPIILFTEIAELWFCFITELAVTLMTKKLLLLHMSTNFIKQNDCLALRFPKFFAH